MAATPSDPAGSPAKTDAELLAALAVDPSSALGTLYDRYAGLVYGLAMRVLGTPGFLVNPSGTVRRVALAGIEVDERIRTGAAA